MESTAVLLSAAVDCVQAASSVAGAGGNRGDIDRGVQGRARSFGGPCLWRRLLLLRCFGGRLRLQPDAVHGDDGVGVLFARLGRGVQVAHLRQRLGGGVVMTL